MTNVYVSDARPRLFLYDKEVLNAENVSVDLNQNTTQCDRQRPRDDGDCAAGLLANLASVDAELDPFGARNVAAYILSLKPR